MTTIENPTDFVQQEREAIHTKEDIIAKHERCPFCNSKLIFTHDLNLSMLQVVENSRCPGCGVTMRPKNHSLH